MRRTPRQLGPLALAAACAALFLASCSQEDQASVPVACKAGRGSMRAALRTAPRPVRLGGLPLSACLTTSSDQADITGVGSELIAVAADLAERARRKPDGPDALRLGYLVEAVRRGADVSQGVNDEIVRRVEQELITVDTSSPAYRRGASGGRASG